LSPSFSENWRGQEYGPFTPATRKSYLADTMVQKIRRDNREKSLNQPVLKKIAGLDQDTTLEEA
jgi:hypothetical protein